MPAPRRLPPALRVAEITEDGRVILYDASGAERSFPALSRSLADAAVSDILWPSEVPWITEASSPTSTVPSSVSLTVDPTALGTDFDREHAVLVLVADTRAGSPPDNVAILPIMMMCAEGRVLAPTLLR